MRLIEIIKSASTGLSEKSLAVTVKPIFSPRLADIPVGLCVYKVIRARDVNGLC